MSHSLYVHNTNTGEYLEVSSEDLPDNWPDHYPHLKGCDYPMAHSIWDHDKTPQGIPYVYDLCRDGMLASLLADTDKYLTSEIDAAKKWMYETHDVVRLRVELIQLAKPVPEIIPTRVQIFDRGLHIPFIGYELSTVGRFRDDLEGYWEVLQFYTPDVEDIKYALYAIKANMQRVHLGDFSSADTAMELYDHFCSTLEIYTNTLDEHANT